ncbi:hypothetical protein GCM10022408_37130 [Hymenobacter fastidiosus]|uniref:Uncharacterized protein n=1 Tax=Hymenobacter fastidiosus TaxID=486264 RepID=A0ABP7T246_9BACT
MQPELGEGRGQGQKQLPGEAGQNLGGRLRDGRAEGEVHEERLDESEEARLGRETGFRGGLFWGGITSRTMLTRLVWYSILVRVLP